jgi:hypothetical protein
MKKANRKQCFLLLLLFPKPHIKSGKRLDVVTSYLDMCFNFVQKGTGPDKHDIPTLQHAHPYSQSLSSEKDTNNYGTFGNLLTYLSMDLFLCEGK